MAARRTHSPYTMILIVPVRRDLRADLGLVCSSVHLRPHDRSYTAICKDKRRKERGVTIFESFEIAFTRIRLVLPATDEEGINTFYSPERWKFDVLRAGS